jgi:hypothetical protein
MRGFLLAELRLDIQVFGLGGKKRNFKRDWGVSKWVMI